MMDAWRFWRYYRYPARQWAMSIREILVGLATDDVTLIDAPCGDGVVSYWLIKGGVGRKYELYDISARAIPVAQRMHRWRGAQRTELHIEQKHIFDIPIGTATNDIWLLINSLYLLPDIDRLLNQMHDRVRTIIGIFPRINSTNYKCYISQSPATNINEMGRAETIEFFARHGYLLDEQRDLCHIPLMCVRSKLLRLAASYVVNPVAGFYPQKEACYWLGVFSKPATSLPRL
jgi:SAM-dependent methyltransferase